MKEEEKLKALEQRVSLLEHLLAPFVPKTVLLAFEEKQGVGTTTFKTVTAQDAFKQHLANVSASDHEIEKLMRDYAISIRDAALAKWVKHIPRKAK